MTTSKIFASQFEGGKFHRLFLTLRHLNLKRQPIKASVFEADIQEISRGKCFRMRKHLPLEMPLEMLNAISIPSSALRAAACEARGSVRVVRYAQHHRQSRVPRSKAKSM